MSCSSSWLILLASNLMVLNLGFMFVVECQSLFLVLHSWVVFKNIWQVFHSSPDHRVEDCHFLPRNLDRVLGNLRFFSWLLDKRSSCSWCWRLIPSHRADFSGFISLCRDFSDCIALYHTRIVGCATSHTQWLVVSVVAVVASRLEPNSVTSK